MLQHEVVPKMNYLILFDTICIYMYSTWRHLIWDFQLWHVVAGPQ
jgi:hypothetical protein